MISLYTDKFPAQTSWPNRPTVHSLESIVLQAKENARSASKKFRDGRTSACSNPDGHQSSGIKRGRENLDYTADSQDHTPTKQRSKPFKDVFGVQVYGFPQQTSKNNLNNDHIDVQKSGPSAQDKERSEELASLHTTIPSTSLPREQPEDTQKQPSPERQVVNQQEVNNYPTNAQLEG